MAQATVRSTTSPRRTPITLYVLSPRGILSAVLLVDPSLDRQHEALQRTERRVSDADRGVVGARNRARTSGKQRLQVDLPRADALMNLDMAIRIERMHVVLQPFLGAVD